MISFETPCSFIELKITEIATTGGLWGLTFACRCHGNAFGAKGWDKAAQGKETFGHCIVFL
jgi:hypothetical protein